MCCLRHLPCWWPDSKSYVRLSAIAQLRVPSFTWEWWQISASWAFLSAWPGSIHLLIAGKLKYFYPGLGWGTACWGSVSSENRGYLCSVKQLWCSVHPVSLGCSRWDSRNCSTCGSTGLENPNLWGLKADKTKPLIVISLDVVVPKSQSRAQLLGLVDCSERLGSAPAEMGVPQLHCLPSVAAAFWDKAFWYLTSVSVPFCSTPTLPTQSESWVLFVSWLKILVTGGFTTWALKRKQMWWVVLPCETTSQGQQH